MDMNDPVMLAMMKKCKNQKSSHDNSDGHHGAEKSESKCGNMSDGHHDKKAESKCGGDMKKSVNKVEKKNEEHGNHDH